MRAFTVGLSLEKPSHRDKSGPLTRLPPHNYSSARSAARLRPLDRNAALAAQAAHMLTRLLITGGWKWFSRGAFVSAGPIKSSCVIPAGVARAHGRPARCVHAVRFVHAAHGEPKPSGSRMKLSCRWVF
jgi:hypothetical protein